MIKMAIAQCDRSGRCETVHLPFFFTPEVKTARKGSARKGLELLRVLGRLLRIRMAGPIDLLLYPSGGPHTTPMIRDLFLLPPILVLSRRVVLHFHAAGIADQIEKGNVIARLLRFVYRTAFAAIVNTDFGRRDPESSGINRIIVLPLRLTDDFDATLVRRGQGPARILYVGHLCADKGTPQLLEAFAALLRTHSELELELVGECLPPFNEELLQKLIDDLGIRSHVRLSGVLVGKSKLEAFGRADLFVFPTMAPYESFGLVLVEAMVWKLPIVASNWRGNSDVLTPRAAAIRFPVSSLLSREIAGALDQALKQRADWPDWGRINRSVFEEHYRDNGTNEWLVGPILSLLVEPASPNAPMASPPG